MNRMYLSGDNGVSQVTENKPIDPQLFGQPTPKSNPTPNSKARRKMHYNNRI